MKYLAWILAAILALALPASPAAAQCTCAGSSLMGTSVNTSAGFLGLNPANTVTSAVEIPTSASVLFPASAGTTPRTTVDYGPNTIRVTFVQQAQSYGGPIAFAFTNLNPTPPAGCTGTPQIVGMTVQTNKPGAGFVASGATFGPHNVSVPYSPASTTTTWQPGEFILVTLQFGCPGTPTTGGIDPCCPPWNATQLKAHLFYLGTGAIGAPYTLAFVQSAALNLQMNTYAAYLQSLGLGFTGVTIQFQLFNAGTGPSAVPTGVPMTGSATWTGSGAPTLVPTGFFPTGALTAGPSGPWHRIQTTIVLNGGPGSSFLPAGCLVSFVDVRLQVI